MKSFKRILVPTDFSSSSIAALDVALSLAKAFDAELTLLHSWEIPIYPYPVPVFGSGDIATAIERAATKQLEEELERAQKDLPRAKSVLVMGSPWQEIVDKSKQLQTDLIVMGTHGRRGLSHVLLGSVAERVVRLAEVPVLTVHGPKSD